jgi:hypothetical protein
MGVIQRYQVSIVACAGSQKEKIIQEGSLMARPKLELKEPTTKEEGKIYRRRLWARANMQKIKDNNNRVNSAYKKLREMNNTILATNNIYQNYNYFGEGE